MKSKYLLLSVAVLVISSCNKKDTVQPAATSTTASVPPFITHSDTFKGTLAVEFSKRETGGGFIIDTFFSVPLSVFVAYLTKDSMVVTDDIGNVTFLFESPVVGESGTGYYSGLSLIPLARIDRGRYQHGDVYLRITNDSLLYEFGASPSSILFRGGYQSKSMSIFHGRKSGG